MKFADIPDLITYILTGGAGIGVWKAGEFFINKKKVDVASFEALKTAYQQEFARLGESINGLNVQIGMLQSQLEIKDREISVLKAQLENMKKAFPDLPIPLWLKDRNGIMLSLNDAYEKAFLIPQGKHRGDYIMQDDKAIWPERVAELFKKNDLKAIERGKSVRIVFEEAPEMDILKNWQFIKYPYYIDGTLIGIGGIAIPLETIKV